MNVSSGGVLPCFVRVRYVSVQVILLASGCAVFDPILQQALQARVDEVEGRLREACRRAGRSRGEVTLVAVTKSVSTEVAACLHGLGIANLGESRPQELWHKAAILPASVCWHLVGHLQRNKVERTLPLIKLVHSVDSVRLLEALDQEAARQDITVTVLLEVNASREAAKHGFAPEDIEDLLPRM